MAGRFGKLALLANGAGAKGICQGGMMQGFVDHGVEYDVLYGSSAGSLNGAFLHSGDMETLHEIWMNIRNRDVMSWSAGELLSLINSRACFNSSEPMLKTIKKYIKPAKLRANPKTFYIGATVQYDETVHDGDVSWDSILEDVKTLTDEETFTMLRASASVPVFFPAVKYRDKHLVDAGVVNNYDILSAIKDGADTLVLLGFAKPEPMLPRNIKENIGQIMSMMMHGYLAKELSAVEKINELIATGKSNGTARPIKVVKIIPPKPIGVELLDFDMKGKDRQAIWDYGYNLARTILKEELS